MGAREFLKRLKGLTHDSCKGTRRRLSSSPFSSHLKYKTGLFLQPDREQGLQTLSQLRGQNHTKLRKAIKFQCFNSDPYRLFAISPGRHAHARPCSLPCSRACIRPSTQPMLTLTSELTSVLEGLTKSLLDRHPTPGKSHWLARTSKEVELSES